VESKHTTKGTGPRRRRRGVERKQMVTRGTTPRCRHRVVDVTAVVVWKGDTRIRNSGCGYTALRSTL
jgi:hypothetical protein